MAAEDVKVDGASPAERPPWVKEGGIRPAPRQVTTVLGSGDELEEALLRARAREGLGQALQRAAQGPVERPHGERHGEALATVLGCERCRAALVAALRDG